jgi:hypothetical protein
MTRAKKWWLGLAVAAGVSQAAWAQAPAVPGGAAAAAPGAAAAGGQPGMVPGAPGYADVAPQPPGGMIGNMIKGCEYIKFKCHEKFCNSVLGQMVNNTLKPAGALTGGLIPQCCPPNAVNPADLAKPADSAEGAAARIKADEAGAKARRAALRYLGTVDCHYWPEAIDALINGLRADRNECVRLEAALALGNGCCCNPKTITALGIAAAGTDEDGNPAETSERVRAAAFVALNRCVDRFPPAPEAGPPPEPVPEPVPGPEPVPPPKPGPEGVPPPLPKPAAAGAAKPAEKEKDKPKVVPAVFYQRVASLPMPQVVAKARKQLHANAVVSAPAGAAHAASAANQGILGMAYNAMTDPTPLPIVEGKAAPGTQPTAEAAGGPKPSAISVTPPAKAAPAPGGAGQPHAPSLTPLPAGQPLPILPPGTGASTTPPTPQPRPIVTPAQMTAPANPPLSVYPPMRTGALTTSPPPAPPKDAAPIIITAPPVRPTQAPPLPPLPPLPPSTYQPVVPAGAVVDTTRGVIVPARAQTQTAVVNPTPAPAPVFRPAVPAATARPEAGADEQAARLLAVLRDAPDAEARDWAAGRLQHVNWRSHPEVVQALVSAALKDPTPAVRTSCIRSLNQMDAQATNVLTALDTLLADRDPAVKQAAEEALRGLLLRRRQR